MKDSKEIAEDHTLSIAIKNTAASMYWESRDY